jgi:hypothetical protein
MKRIFAIAILSVWFAACDDNQTRNEPIGNPATSSTEDQDRAVVVYKPENGDVTYRNGKLLVMRDGEWKEEDDKVVLDNGAVVHTDGRVTKDGKEVTLQDGEVVNKEGNIFDKTGHAIESAWKDTKEGVKDAGKEIEKGANKAGDKIKDAVDDDDK